VAKVEQKDEKRGRKQCRSLFELLGLGFRLVRWNGMYVLFRHSFVCLLMLHTVTPALLLIAKGAFLLSLLANQTRRCTKPQSLPHFKRS
jgi:hypothetical protein